MFQMVQRGVMGVMSGLCAGCPSRHGEKNNRNDQNQQNLVLVRHYQHVEKADPHSSCVHMALCDHTHVAMAPTVPQFC